MQTSLSRVVRWNVRCLEFQHRSITYVLAADSYGRLLGRTTKNELAEFSSWTNSAVFEEAEQLVARALGRRQGISDCFRRILGVVCDPSPSGEQYRFTGDFQCLVCGSTNVEYGPDDPPQFETIELPLGTHYRWDQLSQLKRSALIQEALHDGGCLPWDTYLEGLRLGRSQPR